MLAALVVTVGAAQARVTAPVVAKERQELIDRVESETKAADKLQDDVDGAARPRSGDRQRKALEKHGGDQGELVALLSGATEVHGPGVKLVVDDAKETGQGDGSRRARARRSRTPAGCGTATCSASSTGCGSPARRRSPSTGSV